MAKSKLSLENSYLIWSDKRRYKVNAIVTHLGSIYQNLTGKNSEPGVGEDWFNTTDPITLVTTDDVENTSDVIGATTTEALNNLNIDKEDKTNKATDFSAVNNTLYPSVQAVQNYIGDLGYAIDSTGSVINFDDSRVYGNIALLEGAISYNFTDAKFMCTVFLMHKANNIALPSGSVVVQGKYKPLEINYIQLVYINDSKILVYFNNIDTTNTSLSNITFTSGGTGGGVTIIDPNTAHIRGTTLDFKVNYMYTSLAFNKGQGVVFKAIPVLTSTTVRLFAAFVTSENANFALNTICGFTIRSGELRVWNGVGTTFVKTLSDVDAKFIISIDQNNKCRFTSEVDGDYISSFTVPDGSKFQIWFADEDGTINPSYGAGTANDIDLFQIFKTVE